VSAIDERVSAAAMRLFAERGATEVSMSELAIEARVARGTLYRNIGSTERLYARLIETMAPRLHSQMAAGLDQLGATDPAVRLATALRLFVRLASADPVTGKFLVRFGLSDESLNALLAGPPMRDIEAGIASGRYQIAPGSTLAAASMISGATVSAMRMATEGHLGWRDAGSSTAELVLRALGVGAQEAAEISQVELPTLKLA
jgi:AcrR family transcriptional regulator